MDDNTLFDALLDLIVASNVTPQSAVVDVVGVLHAILRKLPAPEREAWFRTIERLPEIYRETSRAVVEHKSPWLN